MRYLFHYCDILPQTQGLDFRNLTEPGNFSSEVQHRGGI